MCAMGIDFAYFYHFSIGLWNCSDSVVFFGCFYRMIYYENEYM
jgi:hypothetical protein